MDAPTTKQFRIGELKAILADVDALQTRIIDHKLYLTDPKMVETHREDCRDNDVVCANLTLAMERIDEGKRQLNIALKLSDTPDQLPTPDTESQPDPETL